MSPPKSSGQSSFKVPRKAIKILLQNNATAWQIGVYLTLARFSDPSGKFTPAGYEAIYKYTGASPGTENCPGAGRQTVTDLLNLEEADQHSTPVGHKDLACKKVLYTVEDWCHLTTEEIPETPHALYPNRFVITPFTGEGDVWFPAELVDGYGKIKQPLKRLKQIGDVAARLLIYLYMVDNFEEFGGIPPSQNIWCEYATQHLHSVGPFTFWRAKPKGFRVNPDVILAALGQLSQKGVNKKHEKLILNNLESLVNLKYILLIPTVFDGPCSATTSRPIYELIEDKVGDERIVTKIDHAFWMATCDLLSDSQGRFRRGYPVISRVGIRPYVVGVFRLRFRITNVRNAGISKAYQRRMDDQNFLDEVLEEFHVRISELIERKKTETY